MNYSNVRRKNPDKDFNSSICPLFEARENNVVVVNLLILTDGVNIKKSTYKKELWPIWIQVADLPPKLRSARKCIVLAALSVSDSYLSWQEVIPHVNDEISSGLIVEVRDEVYYKFVFKTRLLIADLGAKKPSTKYEQVQRLLWMPVLYGKRKNNWANSCVLSI